MDASVLVDLLVEAPVTDAVVERLRGEDLVAPAHVDAEVLSALGRMTRANTFDDAEVPAALRALTTMSLERRPVSDLLAGAWVRRGSLRLADAVYVELAAQLDIVVVTTDQRLARATPLAEVVTA